MILWFYKLGISGRTRIEVMQVQIQPKSRYFLPSLPIALSFLRRLVLYYITTTEKRGFIGFMYFSMDHTAKKKMIKERELI